LFIVGITSDRAPGYDSAIVKLWRGLAQVFKLVPDTSFNINSGCGFFGFSSCTAFFGDERSDRIVSRSSQEGGLTDPQMTLVFAVDHITAHDDEDVANWVITFLEVKANDPNFFSPVLPKVP